MHVARMRGRRFGWIPKGNQGMERNRIGKALDVYSTRLFVHTSVAHREELWASQESSAVWF